VYATWKPIGKRMWPSVVGNEAGLWKKRGKRMKDKGGKL
jgi:hypothetical protein